MRTLVVPLLLLLLLGSTAALAEDEPKKPAAPPPKPLTDEQAADAVLAAVKAKDPAALKALAVKDNPDPWLVADLLCYRGEHDTAEAFAKAAPRPDTEKLPAYVEAWRTREPDKADRELMRATNAAWMAGQLQRVIEGTAALPAMDTVIRVRLHGVRGMALGALRQFDKCMNVMQGAADAARGLGWLTRAVYLYRGAGVGAYRGAAWAHALASNSKLLALEERRGDQAGVAAVLGTIGVVHLRLGNYQKGLATLEQALADLRALGDKYGAALALGNIGMVHQDLGDYPKALAIFEQALAEDKALGDKRGAARVLGNIGAVHIRLGDYAKALATFEQVGAELRALGDERGAAKSLANIGIVHSALGDYAKALATYEQALAKMQALGDKHGAAVVLGNIGGVHRSLGDDQKALATYEQALAEKKAVGDKYGAALTLGSIGNVHASRGDYPKALAILEQALAELQALGEKVGAASALGNIANVHASLGDYARALATLEQVLAEQKALGDKRGAASTHGRIGAAHARRGDYPKALPAFKRSAEEARSLRATPVFVGAQQHLARLHLLVGKPARALAAARTALDALEDLLGGLGEEQGATAREQYASLFGIGTLAAVREEDAAEAVAFLESGRAGALLDTLDKREALRWKAESLSPELRQADLTARAAESAARRAYDGLAKRGGTRKERLAASNVLDSASEGVREVAGRIQRALKQQANLFYPRPKTVYNIRESIEKDQALVLYGFFLDDKEDLDGKEDLDDKADLDEALALVLRHDGERIVSLGKASEVAAACEALDATDVGNDPSAALDALRKLLVEPLKLGADVKQVLVSPEGPLCYVPFGALFAQPIAMTPSGTTHVLLLGEERKPGKGILALGEPDYGGASKAAQAIYYRGRTLSPLPATRIEVETIGTQRLLGAKASEAGLKEALPATKRWRAVHFACHGLVDIERPMLSSLALSRAGDDDGFLTALEILRLKIPADLAVLSACETGRGKIVKGEGIVGLTRAFMFAGAPRVICSLWKVDDEATQALMIEFYRLWNPKDGTKGLGAAAALKKAQAYVRDHKAKDGKLHWKHPYYWAAWVLWGLPN